MSKDVPKTILIAGPTASGKSALALALAERHGGVIVNADSMQVYRDLRIITARPTPEEERRAPHRLYGHVDAAENYSVGRWYGDVAAALTAITQEARPAIITGGTGLYFTALTRGLAAVPPIPAEIRAEVRGRLASEGAVALHADLVARDPVAAERLQPGDRARVTRALEVVLATGRSLFDWHEDNKPACVDLARAVGARLATRVVMNADGVQAASDVGGGFYLHAAEIPPSLHDEVKGMAHAIGLGHHETERGRFVQKGHLAQISLLTVSPSAFPVRFADRALLGRWNASVRSPVFVHGC